MDAHELRETFLRFFEERGHRRLPGAPIVPPGDPTLLFTSAGMVQFKPYFTGQARPPHNRLTTVQRCFRTSDIEAVGDTSHLTFFEMLGNFSIGDYFKAEMIPWAWEFVTQVLGLTPERLWPAVYLDDDEAYGLWRQVGVPAERIMRYGEDHNYWFSGEVGPCGPCSEIHYDFGERFGCGPACEPAHDCPRFVEIWNLVFMSFYCEGESRTPLPSRNIDTGSGLERVATALLFESDEWDKSRLPSVYDTGLFRSVIAKIEELSGRRYGDDPGTDRAMRIVAEHARAVTFLVGDERTPVPPSNEERGYVVRRLLRRAVYFARRQLGIEQPLVADLAQAVIETMTPSYPELQRTRAFVLDILEPEQARFIERVDAGETVIADILKARAAVAEAYDNWCKARDAIVNGYDPEQYGLLLSAPEHDMRSALRGIWLVIGPGPQLPRPPSFLVQHVAFLLGNSFDDVSNAIQKMDRAVRSAMSETGRSLSDKRTVALARERVKGPFGELKTADARFGELVNSLQDTITGHEAFVLHDTYGFPIELTREIAAQHGFTVDEAGFQVEMERQRERARAHAGGAEAVAADALYASLVTEATAFLGYETLEARSKIVALLVGRRDRSSDLSRVDLKVGPYEVVETAEAPAAVEVLLAETPFYPEGGGQVGDRGEIVGPQGHVVVEDTQRVAERLIVHRGCVVEGRIGVGDEVTARVNPELRADTMRNHTATHLLHAALRRVLGTHVRQAGSLVAPDRLRFDFTHTEAVTPEQLAQVGSLVNEKVRQNLPVQTRTASFDQAMSEGVLAFFGEKYGEEVRVVEVNSVVPRFSAELCGGTHCHRTGEIGLVIVTGESSIGAGMRRIEALTGRGVEEYVRRQRETLDEIARRLGAPREVLDQKVESLVAEHEALRKRIERIERSLASAPTIGQLVGQAASVDGVSVLAARVEATSIDALRYYGDALRRELASGVAVLAAEVEERPQFIAIVSRDLIERGLHAGNLLKRVASVAGGGGGGRPDMAQGGGKDPSKIEEALAVVPEAVREMLATAGN